MKCDCQHCKTPLEFDAEHAGQAIECPSCGKFTVLAGDTPSKATEEPHVKRMRILKYLVVAVLVYIIFNTVSGYFKQQKAFDEVLGFQTLKAKNPIYEQCLDAVKAKLVSPATVIVVKAQLNQDLGKATVRFDLDSQNSNGALVRQEWHVQLKENERGWRVVSVKEESR